MGRPLTDLIDRVEETIGRRIVIDRRPGRAFDVPINVLDIALARAELDWAPEIAFEDGLRLTSDWYRTRLTEGADSYRMAAPSPAKAVVR